MPDLDLKSDEGLRRACEEAEARMDEDVHAGRLRARVALLQEVRATPTERRSSVEFLEKLWFDETFYAQVPQEKDERLSEVIAEESFRNRFGKRIAIDLPERENHGARVEALEQMRKDLVQQTKDVQGYRLLLRVNRVLSALFPEDLVHLPVQERLFGLLRAMGGRGSEKRDHVTPNAWIRRRLGEVMGPPDGTLEAIARRQYLPELLATRLDEESRARPASRAGRTDRPGADAEEVTDQAEEGNGPVKREAFSEVWTRFEALVKQQDLRFDRADVESLHLGLWADEQRHFAVLAGLSGTGKTRLACNYGQALVGGDAYEAKRRVLTVRVQPGWHDPAPLLGYSNPLAGGAYQRTEFLDFLIRASERPAEIHVCVLDEMNLSHPEQYLAPLLSAMEQRRGSVALHRGAGTGESAGPAGRADVPESVEYPANLVLIGTVNMDETTVGLSDKVLDRAFTVEFWDVEVAKWPGWKKCKLDGGDAAEVQTLLADLMTKLRPARLHFGWRVIAEVVRYLEARERKGGMLGAKEALDRVIYAKVLPKLRGDDSPRYEEALGACGKVLRERGLKRSAAKVEELDEDREATGSVRFWR